MGGIDFQGIGVESARSRTVLPPWEAPEPPERVDDPKILFVQEGDSLTALPALQDSEEFVPLQFEASQLPPRIDVLMARNRNTHRIVQFRNIRIYDKTARGDYRAVNPLSSAEDAVIDMNGIEITRESNEIDDLLPGVNITLHGAGDQPVSLSVARDLESIKEGLYNFIGYYNQLLMHVDILTRQDEQVLEAAVFLDDDEKEQAEEDLGLFQGNTTLMQLKSRLQRIMMDPHPTDGGRSLSLLAQIGISTSGGGFQSSGMVDGPDCGVPADRRGQTRGIGRPHGRLGQAVVRVRQRQRPGRRLRSRLPGRHLPESLRRDRRDRGEPDGRFGQLDRPERAGNRTVQRTSGGLRSGTEKKIRRHGRCLG